MLLPSMTALLSPREQGYLPGKRFCPATPAARQETSPSKKYLAADRHQREEPMPVFEVPLDQMRTYLGRNPRPPDFEQYWDRALAEMHSLDPRI